MRRYRSVGLRPPLPQRTLDYLAHGADEGRRNAELFDAACQFRDAGIAADEAETQLIRRQFRSSKNSQVTAHGVMALVIAVARSLPLVFTLGSRRR